MDKDIALKFTNQIAKQRNLFLVLCMLSVSSSFLLAVKLWTKDERIIMVPGLMQEMWVEKEGVAGSYLIEWTPRYLHLLLNLNKDTIDYHATSIMKYISQSDPKYMQNLQEYFIEKREEYQKFGLTTIFTEKSIVPNSKEMSVVVNGMLTTFFGDSGRADKPASYKLFYEWIHGKLRLKEFVRIKSEEEKAEDIRQEEEKKRKMQLQTEEMMREGNK